MKKNANIAQLLMNNSTRLRGTVVQWLTHLLYMSEFWVQDPEQALFGIKTGLSMLGCISRDLDNHDNVGSVSLIWGIKEPIELN